MGLQLLGLSLSAWGQVFGEESQAFERQAVKCCWDYGHAAEIEGWQVQESFPKGWRRCDELQQAYQDNKFQSWTGVGRGMILAAVILAVAALRQATMNLLSIESPSLNGAEARTTT